MLEPQAERTEAARRTPQQHRAPTAKGFRPDIEGLRAIAVLGVVAYHAHLPGVRGGFVGVDVFLVVSGYLITGLLWREHEQRGRIALAAFYGRRARRLLPAAVLTVAVTAVAARLLVPPLQLHQVLGDGVAAALYVANYRFAAAQTNYLNASAPPSPFQHFWSLGVEEQFYLVWPLLLGLAALAAHRRHRARQPQGRHARTADQGPTPMATQRRYAAVALAVLTAVSAALAVHLTATNQPWAFFSLPTRAWELGAGGLLALGAPLTSRLPRKAGALFGLAGLAGVLGAVLGVSPNAPFPGVIAFWPVGATLAVLAGGTVTGPNVGAARMLANRPARQVGRISYSWYLWHWPILTLAPYAFGHDPGTVVDVALAAAGGGVAAASYRWVESPLRASPWLARRDWRSLGAGLTLTAVGAAACLVASATLPALVGHGEAHLSALSPAPPRLAAAPPVSPAQLAADLTTSVQAQVAAAATPAPVPANLRPTVAAAIGDQSQIFTDGCMDDYRDATLRPCTFGDAASPTRVMLVGDSHAASWFPAVDAAATSQHWHLTTLTKALCPPLVGLHEFIPVLGRQFPECDTWRAALMAKIAAERPAVVVLSFARHYQSVYRIAPYGSAWLAALDRTVRAIEATGSRVVVIGPVPKPPGPVPTCLAAHLADAAACATPAATAINARGKAAEQAVAQADGAAYLDVEPWFCTATSCPAVVGDVNLWRDDNHITATWANHLAPVVTASLGSLVGPHP